MRRAISTAGLASVIFYLAVVLLLHLEAKHCGETDGLFCGLGYMIAGFPWAWIFLSLADAFLPEYSPAMEQQLFVGVCVASVIINTVIFYFIGRFIGKVIVRRRVGMLSNGAT